MCQSYHEPKEHCTEIAYRVDLTTGGAYPVVLARSLLLRPQTAPAALTLSSAELMSWHTKPHN